MFEATFRNYFLKINMYVVGFNINCKRISKKGNIKEGICFNYRNYIFFDVHFFRDGEIFISFYIMLATFDMWNSDILWDYSK